MLKGLPLLALQRTYKERVRLNPGAKSLVATMMASAPMSLRRGGNLGLDNVGRHRKDGAYAPGVLRRDGRHRRLGIDAEMLGRFEVGLQPRPGSEDTVETRR